MKNRNYSLFGANMVFIHSDGEIGVPFLIVSNETVTECGYNTICRFTYIKMIKKYYGLSLNDL